MGVINVLKIIVSKCGMFEEKNKKVNEKIDKNITISDKCAEAEKKHVHICWNSELWTKYGCYQIHKEQVSSIIKILIKNHIDCSCTAD